MSSLSFETILIRTIVIAVIAVTFSSCASPQSPKDTRNVAQKTPADLRPDIQTELTESFGQNCEQFVNSFPTDFSTFTTLYGFDDANNVPRPLYGYYEEHIRYFFSCSKQMDSQKILTRLVTLCSGGKWDADAVELLQTETLAYIESNPAMLLTELSTESNDRSASFWYFLFDGPHPNSPENRENYKIIRGLIEKDKLQSRILTAQYNRLLREGRKDL